MEEIRLKAVSSRDDMDAHVQAIWFDKKGRKHIRTIAVCLSVGNADRHAEIIAHALNCLPNDSVQGFLE